MVSGLQWQATVQPVRASYTARKRWVRGSLPPAMRLRSP